MVLLPFRSILRLGFGSHHATTDVQLSQKLDFVFVYIRLNNRLFRAIKHTKRPSHEKKRTRSTLAPVRVRYICTPAAFCFVTQHLCCCLGECVNIKNQRFLSGYRSISPVRHYTLIPSFSAMLVNSRPKDNPRVVFFRTTSTYFKKFCPRKGPQ